MGNTLNNLENTLCIRLVFSDHADYNTYMRNAINNNKENKMSFASIAAIIFISADSPFVRSMMIMDLLRKNNLANSPQNNKSVQQCLDNMSACL